MSDREGMMGVVPEKIMERRASWSSEYEAHHSAILLHESELRAERAEMSIIAGRLAELDFAIAAYAAEPPNAEAGEQGTASGAISGAPEAEIAPAGTSCVWPGCVLTSSA